MLSDPSVWPAISYKPVPWTSTAPAGGAPRARPAAHRGDYLAAVPADIAALAPWLPPSTTAAAEEAAAEIARFDAELGGEIAPFGAVLLRSESAASSQIENLTASARAIAEAELAGAGRPNATEIVANTRAMEAAVALAGRLDAGAVLDMHRALMLDVDPAAAGHFRTEQVWIGGSSLGPHRATFVPPRHERVGPLIEDLMAFAGRDDLPVLVQAALAHAQFETVHPFTDGNGRTGRALLHAMLRAKGLTRNVTVPVSAGLLADTRRYFDALTAYHSGDPSAIVDRLADAAFAAVVNGRRLVEMLHKVRASWDERVSGRRDAVVWQLADLLLRRPVVDARTVAAELGIAPTNVFRQLRPLESAGVLVESTGRRRNRVWRAPEVLDALDAFAARAGRREMPG